MTAIEPPLSKVDSGEAPAARRPNLWDRLDRLAERAGEWLNPILVKETRQALKSRQFMITFTLVLVCSWGWSMLGVSLIGPNIYHGYHGWDMFCGYFVILAFPLLVIVPFGAFRSLAGEREDGTYELLSVTTLRPRQIVSGKLGSAVVQMLVYFSAVSPCLAFTYLLKGIDFPTVLYVMACAFLASLGLAVVGLVVATATTEKHWQIVLSVALLFGLGWCFFLSLAFVLGELSRSPLPFQDGDFWVFNAALLTDYLSYFVLLFCVASAQLTFASNNRSSLLRAVMLGQQALFTGWMGWRFAKDDGELMLVVLYLAFSGLHWGVMGAFMNGESPELSGRVKRQLPQSFLGRAFLTWFNPGPAAGYVFTVVNMASVLLLAGIALVAGAMFLPGRASPVLGANPYPTLIAFGVAEFSYLVIYLGLGRWLTAVLRRLNQGRMLLGALVQVLLLLAGCCAPLTIHLMIADMRDDYSLLEISNPFWTLEEILTHRSLSPETTIVVFVLPIVAGLVFLGNLPSVVAAVRQVRIAKPQRVAEEDELFELQRHPPQPVIDPLAD
ncbi:MAG TPA: hypothetical protein VMV10_08585 [Pirellulales bacterium]|nr:hypothetical protein [Pirellulales bacterium]